MSDELPVPVPRERKSDSSLPCPTKNDDNASTTLTSKPARPPKPPRRPSRRSDAPRTSRSPSPRSRPSSVIADDKDNNTTMTIANTTTASNPNNENNSNTPPLSSSTGLPPRIAGPIELVKLMLEAEKPPTYMAIKNLMILTFGERAFQKHRDRVQKMLEHAALPTLPETDRSPVIVTETVDLPPALQTTTRRPSTAIAEDNSKRPSKPRRGSHAPSNVAVPIAPHRSRRSSSPPVRNVLDYLCNWSSEKGRCGGNRIDPSKFCSLHRCSTPLCTNGKSSSTKICPVCSGETPESLPFGIWFVHCGRGFAKKSRRRFIVIESNRLAMYDCANKDGRSTPPDTTPILQLHFWDLMHVEGETTSSNITIEGRSEVWRLQGHSEEMSRRWRDALRPHLPEGSGDAFTWHRAPTFKLLERTDLSTPTPIEANTEEEPDPAEEARFTEQMRSIVADGNCNTIEDVQYELEGEFGELSYRRYCDVRDAIATILPTRGDGDGDGGDDTAATPTIKVVVATMNVGNSALKVEQLHGWLGQGCCAEIIAIGLQESVSYEAYDSDSSDDDDEEEESPDPESKEKEKETKSQGKFSSAKTAIKEALHMKGDNVLEAILEHLNKELRVTSPDAKRKGSEYILCSSVSRGEMRLLVFQKAVPMFPIHSVETTAVNTGFKTKLGRLSNKGGILIKIVVGTTSLCFISCHLAAHEGPKHLKRRNDSCVEILENGRLGNKDIDPSIQFDHCFFFGDLNYRVDLTWRPPGGHIDPMIQNLSVEPSTAEGIDLTAIHKNMLKLKMKKSPAKNKKEEKVLKRAAHAMQFTTAYKLIRSGETGLRRLYRYDELERMLADGLALANFTTVRPKFAPTFKVTKKDTKTSEGGTMAYNIKRIPSWCDRILWNSLGDKHKLQLLESTSAESVTTSDHKPCRAVFSLQATPHVRLTKAGVVKFMLVLKFLVLNLRASKFKADAAKYPMQICAITNPADAVVDGPCLSSEIRLKQNEGDELKMAWEPDNTVMKLCCQDMSNVHVFLTLRDRDNLGGTATISLRNLHSVDLAITEDTVHQVPIFRNGLKIGELSVLLTCTRAG